MTVETMDKAEIFNETIRPKLDKAYALCREHEIPVVIAGVTRTEVLPEGHYDHIFYCAGGVEGAQHTGLSIAVLAVAAEDQAQLGYDLAEYIQGIPSVLEGLLLSLRKSGIIDKDKGESSSVSIH